jgi:formylglycine-generating enzyme required for sulfatase activity
MNEKKIIFTILSVFIIIMYGCNNIEKTNNYTITTHVDRSIEPVYTELLTELIPPDRDFKPGPVAVTKNGNIFLGDSYSARVWYYERYDAEPELLIEYGEGAGELKNLQNIETYNDRIYIFGNNLLIYNADGELILTDKGHPGNHPYLDGYLMRMLFTRSGELLKYSSSLKEFKETVDYSHCVFFYSPRYEQGSEPDYKWAVHPLTVGGTAGYSKDEGIGAFSKLFSASGNTFSIGEVFKNGFSIYKDNGNLVHHIVIDDALYKRVEKANNSVVVKYESMGGDKVYPVPYVTDPKLKNIHTHSMRLQLSLEMDEKDYFYVGKTPSVTEENQFDPPQEVHEIQLFNTAGEYVNRLEIDALPQWFGVNRSEGIIVVSDKTFSNRALVYRYDVEKSCPSRMNMTAVQQMLGIDMEETASEEKEKGRPQPEETISSGEARRDNNASGVIQEELDYIDIAEPVELTAIEPKEEEIKAMAKKGYVFVPGGWTIIGRHNKTAWAEKNNYTRTKLWVHSFYISRFEVTRDEYEQFCEAIDRPVPSWPEPKGNKLPATNITIDDALDYCDWLERSLEGNWRLPFSAEWEYAAEGAYYDREDMSQDPSFLNKVAWYKDNSGGVLHPVGQKEPNRLGLYDMLGNAGEFLMDDYQNFITLSKFGVTYPAVLDPLFYINNEIKKEAAIVISRGSSYNHPALLLLPEYGRVLLREKDNMRQPTIGFRVMRLAE